MIIWQYKPGTPVAVLLRNHRIARWTVDTCFFCATAGVSAGAQGLMFGFSPVVMAISVAGSVAGALLFVPAVLMLPWMDDTEKELVKRGVAIPGGVPLNRRWGRSALKLVFWFAVLVFGPVLLRLALQSPAGFIP